MTQGRNLLEPPETLLEENEAARAALDAGTGPAAVAADHPTYSAAWAALVRGGLGVPSLAFRAPYREMLGRLWG